MSDRCHTHKTRCCTRCQLNEPIPVAVYPREFIEPSPVRPDLTDAERTALRAGVCAQHNEHVPGVYVCRPCESAGDAAVERVLAARLAGLGARIGDQVIASVTELIADHPMWIDQDANPLGYLPQREALIGVFINELATRLRVHLEADRA